MKNFNTTKKIRIIVSILVMISMTFNMGAANYNDNFLGKDEILVIDMSSITGYTASPRHSAQLATSSLEVFGTAIIKSRNVISEKITHPEIVEEVAITDTMYVDTMVLNIRERPTVNSPVVGKVTYSTELNPSACVVTGANEEWLECTVGNVDGYIMKDYTTTESPLACIGTFLITHYCGCEICCDIAGRPTASGKMPKSNHTIAADKSIPFGTKFIIDDTVYTVEDRGGEITGNHIDIYCESHEEAKTLGSYEREVYVMRNK